MEKSCVSTFLSFIMTRFNKIWHQRVYIQSLLAYLILVHFGLIYILLLQLMLKPDSFIFSITGPHIKNLYMT